MGIQFFFNIYQIQHPRFLHFGLFFVGVPVRLFLNFRIEVFAAGRNRIFEGGLRGVDPHGLGGFVIEIELSGLAFRGLKLPSFEAVIGAYGGKVFI